MINDQSGTLCCIINNILSTFAEHQSSIFSSDCDIITFTVFVTDRLKLHQPADKDINYHFKITLK